MSGKLLDALAAQFGSGWFLTREIADPKHNQADRLGALCARGLLARRPISRHDPRRLIGQSVSQFEYRVVEP